MTKYKCIQICPELDLDNSNHCIDTIERIYTREECKDYCPYGNEPIWREVPKEEEWD